MTPLYLEGLNRVNNPKPVKENMTTSYPNSKKDLDCSNLVGVRERTNLSSCGSNLQENSYSCDYLQDQQAVRQRTPCNCGDSSQFNGMDIGFLIDNLPVLDFSTPDETIIPPNPILYDDPEAGDSQPISLLTPTLIPVRFNFLENFKDCYLPKGYYDCDDLHWIASQVYDNRLYDVSVSFFINNTPVIDRVLISDFDVISISLPILGAGYKKGKKIVMVTQKNKQRKRAAKPIVVVERRQPKKHSPLRKSSAISNPGMAGEFAIAIKNPFSPKAFGAKCPDTYNFPTITGHVHYEVQLSSASGLAQMVIYPSPMISFLSVVGTTNSGLTPFATNTYASYFSSRLNLSSSFDMYRVVALGVKISNLQPELTATGRLILTPLPIAGTNLGFDFINTTTLNGNYITTAMLGLSQAQLSSSTILQKPSSIEISVQDLLHNTYEFSMVPTSQIFYKFKNPGQLQPFSGYNEFESGEAMFNTTTSAITTNTSGEFQDNMSCEGGVALNILGEGLGTGTCFQIEVIVHLEGTPAISSFSNTVTFSGASTYPGSTTAVEAALNLAARSGAIKALQTGLDYVRDNKGKGFKNIVTGLGDKALKHYTGFGLGDVRTALGY